VARKSDSRLEYVASNSSRRGITTTSRPLPGGSRSDRLKTSRINLLARFLRTASPSFREATIPSLEVSPSFGATSTVKYRPFARCEPSKTRWNSSRCLTRCAFVKRSDGIRIFLRTGRPATTATRRKPSGVYVPWRGAVSTPGAPSWLPCARETHACACGAGGLAGTLHSLSRTPAAEERERRNLNSKQSIQMVSMKTDGCGPPHRVLQSLPPRRSAVGSPPEVFHNCGKKCGKATVFTLQMGRLAHSGPFCRGWDKKVTNSDSVSGRIVEVSG
jgi:hypothetical protein